MSRARILIVEDERHISRFLEFVLQKEGYSLISVATGKQALDILDEFLPDVIVLDLGLPDIDGLDVLRRIRAEEKYSEIKVMVLTATLYEGMSKQLKIAGANAQCSKPIAPSTLLRTIRSFNLEEELGIQR
jgi:DNA-binding response OmpR family regulator